MLGQACTLNGDFRIGCTVNFDAVGASLPSSFKIAAQTTSMTTKGHVALFQQGSVYSARDLTIMASSATDASSPCASLQALNLVGFASQGQEVSLDVFSLQAP